MDFLYTAPADQPAPEFRDALGILSGRIPVEPIPYTPEQQARLDEYRRGLEEQD